MYYDIQKDKKLILKRLREGRKLEYSNVDYTLTLSWTHSFGLTKMYKVYFNGTFTKVTKNPLPLLKEATRLITKYNLTHCSLI